MSAKLLNSFTDENPDLHKQIGCMTGIFQMFNRHHLLTGRRHHRKRLPSGDDALSDSHLRAETPSVTSQIVLEKKLSKSLSENQRVSVESSRTSFSSSSCSSSFSSLEYNKSTQHEQSFDRTAIPVRPLKNTTVESTAIDSRPPPSSPHLYPQNLSSPSCRQPLDFRDIVKDSIHRDSHSLSIKTSNKRENKEEVKKHVLKHKDSPRPLPLPETTHGSYPSSKNERAKMSQDLRVLAKLKEAPRYFSENRPVKLSNEAKDGSFFPMAREASRFSYDGREISRSSLDSREQSKCSTRLRELPRLSLDSRKSSMSSNFDSKTNTLVKDLECVKANQKTYRSLILEQHLETHSQPTSVVARLMGLEAMPSCSGMQGKSDVSEGSITDSNTFRNLEAITPSSKSMKMTGESEEERRSCSPKSSIKGLAVPQSRSVEPTTKPVPNSRIPIEAAPWKQGRSKGKTQQMAVGCREGHVREQHESVYSEIGRKLKGLEFQQSNKDLIALKQILDAIQAKRQLESNRDESPSSEVSYKKSNSNKAVIGIRQNLKTASRQEPHTSCQDMPRPLEASIVIMKPAKSINKSNVSATSLISFHGHSTLSKVRTVDDGDVKKIPANNCLDKEETLRVDLMEPAIHIHLSPSKDSGRHREKGSSQKAHVQMGQVSPRLQQPTGENSGSITKASGSVSPRRQQRKIELEKKSCPPVTSYESTKSKKQFSTRHISECVSPRSRAQSKSEQAHKNSDNLSRNHSDTRNLRNHSDEVSRRTESTASLASQMDMEVTSVDQSVDLISDSGSSSNSAVSNISPVRKEKKSLKDFNEDASADLSIASSLDQPSPVSVLDASFYRDDMPHSPINRISNSFRGDGAQNADAPTGVIWKTAGPDGHLPNNPNCDLNSTSYHKKLESIENLLQKLRKLSLSGDGGSTSYTTSLSQMQSPDTRYVSQVLFASGLLNAGSNATTPVQLHRSGYAVDPNMFFVLEQTKLVEPQSLHEGTARPTCESARLRRRLLFDTVNEILTRKLEVAGAALRHGGGVKLADNIPTGEGLLKGVCLEIERLQAHARRGVNLEEEDDDDDDGLKPMICEDVARQTEGWKDSGKEVAGVVLDIERSLFRDLINEVLNGEAAAFVLDSNPIRRRKQPF